MDSPVFYIDRCILYFISFFFLYSFLLLPFSFSSSCSSSIFLSHLSLLLTFSSSSLISTSLFDLYFSVTFQSPSCFFSFSSSCFPPSFSHPFPSFLPSSSLSYFTFLSPPLIPTLILFLAYSSIPSFLPSYSYFFPFLFTFYLFYILFVLFLLFCCYIYFFFTYHLYFILYLFYFVFLFFLYFYLFYFSFFSS